MQITCEHHGLHASFLDLDITVFDRIYEYKLYDKRANYAFFARMPDITGNIPAYVFYGLIISEFLRITKCKLKYSDSILKAKQSILRKMNK